MQNSGSLLRNFVLAQTDTQSHSHPLLLMPPHFQNLPDIRLSMASIPSGGSGALMGRTRVINSNFWCARESPPATDQGSILQPQTTITHTWLEPWVVISISYLISLSLFFTFQFSSQGDHIPPEQLYILLFIFFPVTVSMELFIVIYVI